jgi:hypothetical protein
MAAEAVVFDRWPRRPGDPAAKYRVLSALLFGGLFFGVRMLE